MITGLDRWFWFEYSGSELFLTQALERQGHQCPVSGLYHRGTLNARQKVDETFDFPGDAVHLQFAHIISNSTNANLDDEGKVGRSVSFMLVCTLTNAYFKRKWASSAWALLQRFSTVRLIEDDLNGRGIHRPGNAIMLQQDVHDCFDRLELWFEAIVSAMSDHCHDSIIH